MHEHRYRKVYLKETSLDKGLETFLSALKKVGALEPLEGETVAVAVSLGRVTSRPVWAKISSPHYHGSAMDGAAVKAVETVGASEVSPVRLKMDKQVRWVDTGDPIPAGFNAVIMIENIHEIDKETIEIMTPVAPWNHVRLLGEDIVATELILPENHRIRPVDMGAIAACGLSEVEVRRKPRVGIMPTGSELVNPRESLKVGEIIEFNSLVLAGFVEEWGGTPKQLGIVKDEYNLIKENVEKALEENDIVVINAGSSAGAEDYTAPVIDELGEVLVHGISIRPGHPVVLGIAKDKPVVGIPGYPVSAILTFDLLVKPVIYRMLGNAPPTRSKMKAFMTRKVLSPMGEDEFLRVKVGVVGDRAVATPLQRGAGIIMSLVRADGLVKIPQFSEGIQSGSEVEVELLREQEEVENTIVAIGSHDLTLDLLASFLSKKYPDLSLASSNVGSFGGLTALHRDEAHFAGSHLLNEKTGEYNVSYVMKLLKGKEIVLLNLVYRDQGLIVPVGNPKNIVGLEDLLRDEVNFVNRQRGSGTRVLLDYKLKEMGVDPSKINGYEREEFTHLAVAADVKSGTADTGLGILAAARALALDFVPLLKERYDLVIPKEYYESDILQPLLNILRGNEFKETVESLGGYDVSQMGQVIDEINV